ncbi:histidine kinase [Tolypothrix sp. VBCCA 56010]
MPIEEGKRVKGKGKRIITNAPCPMPHAQCPITHCPMPHSQLPIFYVT